MGDRADEFDLHRWLDGELSPDEAAAVERALSRDEAANARLLAYARNDELLRVALRSAEPDEVPPELHALADRLGSRLGRRRIPMSAQLLAASVAAFLLGAASHAWLEPLMPWRVPPVVETAASAHEVFEATSEVEVPGSARSELVARVERHLGVEVIIPDLKSVGFGLIGGRLLASEDGPLAQIVYEDDRGVRLTVYISDAETVDVEEMTFVEVADLSAGYWKKNDVAYSVVADMDVESLRHVALEISAITEASRI